MDDADTLKQFRAANDNANATPITAPRSWVVTWKLQLHVIKLHARRPEQQTELLAASRRLKVEQPPPSAASLLPGQLSTTKQHEPTADGEQAR